MAGSLSTVTVNVANSDTKQMRTIVDANGIHTPGAIDLPGDVGACLTYEALLAASTNATVIKAAAGTLYGLHLNSLVNGLAYTIKLYDLAAAPTVGSSTIKRRFTMPATGASAGGHRDIIFPKGIAFTNGIAFATTTEMTDAGTTVLASAVLYSVNFDYA